MKRVLASLAVTLLITGIVFFLLWLAIISEGVFAIVASGLGVFLLVWGLIHSVIYDGRSS